MRRIICLILCVVGLTAFSPRASAQWATFDASNLAQAVLSFLQDGDNMVLWSFSRKWTNATRKFAGTFTRRSR